jgi:PAS domain S-box-containing protein
LAILLGVAIFAIDTLTPLDMAVAVLYVAVVMLLAGSVDRRGIIVVGLICISLTTISFFAMHDARDEPEAVMRALVSIAAIVVTTLLSLRDHRSNASLRGQAALLDLTHDAIIVRDQSDTIIYWNSGAEELYGWRADEAQGRKTAELMHTRFPGTREEANASLLAQARWEGELRHTCKDGSQVLVASRWSLRHNERGQPVTIMETNNDITARKRSEERLHTAQAELAHVNRVATLGQLTTSIAHEVNQPLAAVVTNGEACLRWLRRPAPVVTEAVDSVERMIANARRASDVVARLRALARRDAPSLEPIGVNEVILQALDLIERELSGLGVRLERQLAANLPSVMGDRVQLQQVVINLAMNAAQAMAESGPVRALTVSTQSLESEAGIYAIEVDLRDRGAGIAPEDLLRLFEPFYSTKPNGMGLGLSISRSIIEAHRGRIEAIAHAEGGMTFRITLPLPMKDLPMKDLPL